MKLAASAASAILFSQRSHRGLPQKTGNYPWIQSAQGGSPRIAHVCDDFDPDYTTAAIRQAQALSGAEREKAESTEIGKSRGRHAFIRVYP